MIHCYKLNGYNIVLDVFSGSVHAVDEVAFDAIEMYENNDRETIITQLLEKYSGYEDVTREELSSLLDDIEQLKEDGQLFAPDVTRERLSTSKKETPS